ncbi:MAG: (2Fe-2S) ferredoxin domain-containing protein [Clostridia bacterium]|nr:(2Fe-2S) ferredoxin domain-containing protein [Clostridia bacterium]MBQ8146395.1 (2Fe-2S) ferredoxin domain-containing protein [Clostridia bacterium]
MLIVQVCVGSSCHLKGSAEIVELFEQAIKDNNLEDEVVLVGSFCIGKCNRIGVTIQVDDDIHVGITRENFKEFFNEKILKAIK